MGKKKEEDEEKAFPGYIGCRGGVTGMLFFVCAGAECRVSAEEWTIWLHFVYAGAEPGGRGVAWSLGNCIKK